MTRCGRQCPDCEGIDTAEVLPGLWTCFDCGDEFEPRRISAGAEDVAPPSPSAPALFSEEASC